jgi:GGDEF domain-containing protein
MARRIAPFFYLAVNLALAGSIVWLAIGRLELVPAVALAAGIACIEIGLWYVIINNREAPKESSRLVSIMERSAHARRFSIRDESTGLLNRWYLERRLDEEAARCKRYGYSMAVIVLKAAVPQLSAMSIDNWQDKSAEAAQRCLTVVRNVDLSAVLGPFEFAISLVHCDRPGAQHVVERLVKELREYSCAAGVAVLPDDEVAPDAMIELARVRSQNHAARKIA